MQEVEPRRYRITGVLGKGGFGTVYRATMEGAGGFSKNVALKLLRDEDVPDLTLQRFRDEARILGLVRDRAIVNVDPPTRLAGRWAVVMEYVDGASIQRLLQLGVIPASVTAEIVQEVARVLDKVYRTPGPDSNEPLKLLHRDIKPANIQLTPDGEVKVLDFGIAKAEFATREAHTQAYVGGTKGFIAPERLEGQDGPEGDVFSLGITAHVMLTGERPTRRQMMGLDETPVASDDPDLLAVMELAGRMRAVDPAQRPTARQVEEACAQIRRSSQGPSLRRWAEEMVAKASALRPDDGLVGSVLSETLAALPSSDALASGHELVDSQHTFSPRPRPRSNRLATLAVGAIGLLAVVAMGISAASLVLGGSVVALNLSGAGAPPEAVPVAVTPPPAVPVPEPTRAARPAGASPAPARPVAPPAPAGQPAPAPKTTAPAPAAQPAPAQPAPTEAQPAPAAAVTITFASVPLGATVAIDGKDVGVTPVRDLPLSPGSHKVKMSLPDGAIERTITVGGRNPQRYVWRGGDKWESIY
jgi:serine/threonine protein kinase